MSISGDIIEKLKTFNWQKVIDIVPILENLNDAQWRFLKGFILEIATEKYSQNELIYVAQPHKDFDWPSEKLTIELKSLTSKNFYKNNNQLRSTFNIKLNNSNGTNNKNQLVENEICDILIIISRDGVFCVSKEVVLQKAIKTGDGFSLKLNADDLIKITDKLLPATSNQLDFRKIINEVIRQYI